MPYKRSKYKIQANAEDQTEGKSFFSNFAYIFCFISQTPMVDKKTNKKTMIHFSSSNTTNKI